MLFNIQHAHVSPTGKRLQATKTETFVSVITFTCLKGKLLIFGLCPSLLGMDRYNIQLSSEMFVSLLESQMHSEPLHVTCRTV